jgi:hypothetical protein
MKKEDCKESLLGRWNSIEKYLIKEGYTYKDGYFIRKGEKNKYIGNKVEIREDRSPFYLSMYFKED